MAFNLTFPSELDLGAMRCGQKGSKTINKFNVIVTFPDDTPENLIMDFLSRDMKRAVEELSRRASGNEPKRSRRPEDKALWDKVMLDKAATFTLKGLFDLTDRGGQRGGGRPADTAQTLINKGVAKYQAMGLTDDQIRWQMLHDAGFGHLAGPQPAPKAPAKAKAPKA